MIPLPVLYHHLWRIPFLRFKCPSFLLVIFQKTGHLHCYLSVFPCSILLDAYPIPSRCFVVDISWKWNAASASMVVNVPSSVGWCIVFLTLWQLQKSSIYCCLFAFAQDWHVGISEDSPKIGWPYPGLNGRLRFFNGGLHRACLAIRGPALARKVGLLNLMRELHVCRCLCLFWKVWDFRVCSVSGSGDLWSGWLQCSGNV